MPSDNIFNAACYLNRYPDLKNGYMYRSAGSAWKYGNPSHLIFEVKKISDGTNPFWHWSNFGINEGRVSGCDLPGTVYSSVFNSNAYLARYYDVRTSSQYGSDPQGHYQTIGIFEGRMPGYEVLTTTSPLGVFSPGTTTFTAPAVPVIPGDSTVITTLPPLSGGGDPPVIVEPTAPAAGIMAWVTANPLYAAGIAGVLVFLIYEETKKKKRRA